MDGRTGNATQIVLSTAWRLALLGAFVVVAFLLAA